MATTAHESPSRNPPATNYLEPSTDPDTVTWYLAMVKHGRARNGPGYATTIDQPKQLD